MSQLVIEIDSEENEAILLSLLPKLGGQLIEKKVTLNEHSRREALAEIFGKLKQSGVAEKYGDPSEWQRETRQDRPLAGRGNDNTS